MICLVSTLQDLNSEKLKNPKKERTLRKNIPVPSVENRQSFQKHVPTKQVPDLAPVLWMSLAERTERTDADVTQSHPRVFQCGKKWYKVYTQPFQYHWLTMNKPLFQQLSHPGSCVSNLSLWNSMVKDRRERQRRWSTHLGQNLEMLRRPCAAWSKEQLPKQDPNSSSAMYFRTILSSLEAHVHGWPYLAQYQSNHGTCCFQNKKDLTSNTNSTRLDSLWNFGCIIWHSRRIVVYGLQPYFGVKNISHWCLVL